MRKAQFHSIHLLSIVNNVQIASSSLRGIKREIVVLLRPVFAVDLIGQKQTSNTYSIFRIFVRKIESSFICKFISFASCARAYET